MPQAKKTSPSEMVPKLINVPQVLMAKIEEKRKREEAQLKARRAGTFTSLTLALHEAWVEGRVDPWSSKQR